MIQNLQILLKENKNNIEIIYKTIYFTLTSNNYVQIIIIISYLKFVIQVFYYFQNLPTYYFRHEYSKRSVF